MENTTTKKTAQKREKKIPTLLNLDARTKRILREDADGYGISDSAYVSMLVNKERYARERAHAAGR